MNRKKIVKEIYNKKKWNRVQKTKQVLPDKVKIRGKKNYQKKKHPSLGYAKKTKSSIFNRNKFTNISKKYFNYLCVYVVISMIIVAEIALYYYNLNKNNSVLLIWIFIETSLILVIIFSLKFIKEKSFSNAITALGLLPLFRIINVAVQVNPNTSESLAISYGIVFIGLLFYIYMNDINLWDMGLKIGIIREKGVTIKIGFFSIKKWYPFIIITISLGIILAIIEYLSLRPSSLLTNPSGWNIFFFFILMLVIVLCEELIFRGIIQTRLEKFFDIKVGLILTTVLFGAMHSIWGNYSAFALAFGTGFLFCYLFQRTRNLSLVILLRYSENILLLGFLPFLL